MPKLLTLLFILAIAGCTVETAVEPSFAPPKVFSLSGEEELLPRWWHHFNSAALNQAVERALGSNLTLKIATARIEEMQAAAQKVGAALLPAVETRAAASSQRRNSGASSNNFSLGVAASYELDLWGRLRSIKGAAAAELLASKKAFEVAALTIAAETATTWLLLLENRVQQQLVRKQQTINAKTAAIIEWKVRSGQKEIADLLQQRQLIQRDEAELAELSAKETQLCHRLNILQGKPPQSSSFLSENNELPQLPELPPLPKTGVPLQLLQKRPDVRQAWLALCAADQYTAAAIASRLPSLSLQANAESVATSGRELFSNWLTTLAANLFAPILDGGRRKAEVKRKQAIATKQYHLWTATMLKALQEVEDALAAESSLARQLASRKEQLQLAQNAAAALNRRYRQGTTNYQRVLQATLSAQQLEKSVLHNRLQLLCERINLYRALSGGVPETLFQQPSSNNG